MSMSMEDMGQVGRGRGPNKRVISFEKGFFWVTGYSRAHRDGVTVVVYGQISGDIDIT